MSLLRLLALSALLIGSSFASASTINFTESFTGSGTLDSTVFTNTAISITLSADTADITSLYAGNYVVNAFQTTVTIGGVSYVLLTQGFSAQVFLSPLKTGAMTGVSLSQTSRNGVTRGVFNIGTASDTLTSYDLATGIGPITGPISGSLSKSNTFYAASGSTISLLSTTGTTTFTATPVPEPASLTLFSIGSLGLASLFRRYRSRGL